MMVTQYKSYTFTTVKETVILRCYNLKNKNNIQFCFVFFLFFFVVRSNIFYSLLWDLILLQHNI